MLILKYSNIYQTFNSIFWYYHSLTNIKVNNLNIYKQTYVFTKYIIQVLTLWHWSNLNTIKLTNLIK